MEASDDGKNENKRKTSHDSKEIIVTESRKLLKTSIQQKEPTTKEGKKCLLDLDDDALAAVLLWTNAFDHPSLHCSCKRIHETLSEPSFIKSRCDRHFAQVSVTVRNQKNDDAKEREEEMKDENGLDYEYNIDEDYSFHDRYDDYGCYIGEYDEAWFDGTILVDNIQVGKFSVQILPLSCGDNFHEMADAISDELQYLSVLFFNQRGKPIRVKSVKTAYNEEMSQRGGLYSENENRFIYIKTFTLDAIYKDSTFVGASAVRKILECRPLWKHNLSSEPVQPLPRWSLAMYIPDGDNYNEKPGANYYVKSIFDMKNFLRTGFHQAKEIVNFATCHFVYCTPISLRNTKILTDKEMDKIEIVSKKPKPAMPQYAKDLLEDITQTCSTLDHIQNEIAQCESTLEEVTSKTQQLQRLLAQYSEELSERESLTQQLNQILELSSRLTEPIPVLENQKQILKNEFRSKLEKYVSGNGYKVVLESNGLHCCSSYLNEDVANILLSFIPQEHKKVAIDKFDVNGMTSLMVAAQAGRNFSSEKLKHTTKVTYIEFLLKNNASLTIADSEGRSALGHYRINYRDGLDFMRIFTPGLIDDDIIDKNREMETLLRPLFGQNEADDELQDDANN